MTEAMITAGFRKAKEDSPVGKRILGEPPSVKKVNPRKLPFQDLNTDLASPKEVRIKSKPKPMRDTQQVQPTKRTWIEDKRNLSDMRADGQSSGVHTLITNKLATHNLVSY